MFFVTISRYGRVFLLAMTIISVGSVKADDREPTRLIFDTDMGNDVDDALALGIIHALQTRGEVELLAVTLTKDNELAAPFVDLVNTFYGRGEIPIGAVRDGKTPEAGKFLPLAEKKDGEDPRYPHDLILGEQAPEAVGLLRKVLAAQPDQAVVMTQVGFSTNFARLLASQADGHSDLSGRELVRKKVRWLSVMAGAFKPIGENQQYLEYNVIKDIPAARQIAAEWPTPVVYSGYEIGIAIPYPAASIEHDYGYVEHHPLADAYRLYNPPPHNRPTWDLTSVLYAVAPDRGYFDLSEPGQVTIEDNGYTRFTQHPEGTHRYLIATPEQVVRVTEALVQLASQPPPAFASGNK